jgi:CDP-diglyceride synthetase
MPAWAVLVGGTAGFTIGIFFGHRAGIRAWEAKNQWRGFANYGVTFLVAMVVGFLIQVLAHTFGPWTAFLADWLNALLWTAALGVIGGWLCGYSLGHTRRHSGNSNVESSEEPSIFGAFLGLVAYMILTSGF